MLSFHSDFLDTCLKECLLNNPDLLKVQLLPSDHSRLTHSIQIISKLLSLCVIFSNYMQVLTDVFIP